MDSYEQKKEARRERLLARAAKRRAAAQRLTQRASQQAAMIPLGQPISIGHHSERRDRNFSNRISRAFEKAVELDNLAHAAADRADGDGRSGVSSHDPDAIAKPREQVGKLEQVQERMKAANRALRRGDDTDLRAERFSDAQIAELKKPGFCGRAGFPDYALQNNNANLRRIKQRIAPFEIPKRATILATLLRLYRESACPVASHCDRYLPD